MNRARLSLFLGFLLLPVAGCMRAPEPEGAFLSFLKGREAWQSTRVELTVTSLSDDPSTSGDPSTAGEKAVSIVAEHGPTGETLTFLVLADRLEGTYPVRVFGNLSDLDRTLGRERLLPVSNACAPGDRSDTSGSLTFESHDPVAGTVGGSFIVNVCRVDDADRAWTLGDGKFRRLSYTTGGG